MRLNSRKLQRERRLELSMTSMIDVVFLLLIFFMTTSSFQRTERNLESGIRVRGNASQSQSNTGPTIVDVVESGGQFVYKLGAREMTDDAELLRILRQLENKGEGAFVRVSDAAPFRMAAAAVQACKTAQFFTVSYVPLPASP